MSILLKLYFEFFKIGLFSIGGGLATLPFLYDLSDRTMWFTHADIANMIAIAESTPGAIGANMASYAGYTTAGPLGSLMANLGLISPAIVIIYAIAKVLNKFKGNRYVDSAFYGLRPASIALISAAGLSVAKITLFNYSKFVSTGNVADLFVVKSIILGVLIFAAQKKFPKIHPTVFIFIAAFVGIIFNFSA